MSVMIIWG